MRCVVMCCHTLIDDIINSCGSGIYSSHYQQRELVTDLTLVKELVTSRALNKIGFVTISF